MGIDFFLGVGTYFSRVSAKQNFRCFLVFLCFFFFFPRVSANFFLVFFFPRGREQNREFPLCVSAAS